MKLGEKLRRARADAGLTQEAVAEKIGVSRQTVSNWENERSYPGIADAVRLSELYGVSLDAMLRDDAALLEYWQDGSDAVARGKTISKLIIIAVYLCIWAVEILVFWIGGRADAMGYSLTAFYLVLPGATLILSFWIGRDDAWASCRWAMPFFFGILNLLAPYATFSLSNMMAFQTFHLPQLTDLLPGLLCSAVGIAAGTAAKHLSRARRSRRQRGE